MITLATTFHHIKADFNRRALLEGRLSIISRLLMLFKRGMVGVICYRLSRYFVLNKLGIVYRIILLVEHLYAKNEISPLADIGPGLVLADAGAIGIPSVAIIGKNCTFFGGNTLTLGAIEGVDLAADRIIMGDHCIVGSRAKIMRAINIADGAQIKDNSVVMFSIRKPGTTVVGIPAKKLSVDSYDEIIKWNPISGGMLLEGAQ